ncbi:MAG: ABC transporter permease [Bacillota bacterium]|nr:ABC transporter permease [Bacillota bacterium]
MNWLRLQEALFTRAPSLLAIHVLLVLVTMLLAIAVSVPAGVILTRPKYKKYTGIILNFLNIFQTVPSLAMVAIAMPILGIGFKPAVIVLVAQGLLPIARNTIAGLLGVSASVKEAAMGMGMSQKQILYEVELPLALPVILSGIKTSTVYVVSTATLAAFIGAGGLGTLIEIGLNLLWREYLIVGAGLGALLAIFFDRILSYVEYKFTPPGMRSE